MLARYGREVVEEAGKKGFAVFATNKAKGTVGKSPRISFWHDIPAKAQDDWVFNYVMEIPAHSFAKYEVSKELPHNPIVQDVKNGQLRFLAHGPMPFNYGMIPGTFEDAAGPATLHEGNKYLGDNDPLDVIEVSGKKYQVGEVATITPIAAICLIDSGEVDWKIFAVDSAHPLAAKIAAENGLPHENPEELLEQYFPGTLFAARTWFSDYKLAEGKPKNFFIGNVLTPMETVKLIEKYMRQYEERKSFR